jgi:hypothetical protein
LHISKNNITFALLKPKDSPKVTLNTYAMTHSYQYCASLPHTRRKLNAAFTHRLKKLCGRVYRLHVVEVFDNEEMGDYLHVLVGRDDAKSCILSLCKAYGIGDEYVDVESVGEKERITIYLSQPKH